MNQATKITLAAALVTVLLAIVGGTVWVTRWLMAAPKAVVITVAAPAQPQTFVPLAPAPVATPSPPALAPVRPVPRPQNGYARLAPFTGVRWNRQTPQVQVNGKWYLLVALDDLPTEQIIQFAIQKYGNQQFAGNGPPMFKKRFSEDLVEVLSEMGHPPGDTVKLDLRDPSGGDTITMPAVAMTAENRRAVAGGPNMPSQAGAGQQANRTAGPLRVVNGFAMNGPQAPFTAVQWRDSTPLVKVHGTWYELLSIDTVPIAQILDAARANYPDTTYPGWWRRQFLQTPARLMRDINHPVGDTVDLGVRTLDTKQETTLAKVQMDPMNDILSMQYLRRSPFSGIRWNGTTPQVLVQGTWYEFVSMDDQTLADLTAIEHAADSPADDAFADTSELTMFGHTPGDTVKLVLKTLDTGRTVTLPDVAPTPLAWEQLGLYHMRTPFTGIRWHDTTPEVEVQGKWYQLASVDGKPVDADLQTAPYLLERRLEAWCNTAHPDHGLGESVNLGLITLDTHTPVALSDVPMSVDNFFTFTGWVHFPQDPRPSSMRVGPLLGKVRWNGDSPQIQLSDTWYELESIDDNPVSDIIAFAKQTYGDDWRVSQFEERTEKVLGQFGKYPYSDRDTHATKLKVRTLDTHEEVTILRFEPTGFSPVLPQPMN